MKKKLTLIIVLILLFAGVYLWTVQTNENGLTRKDIYDAKQALRAYFEAFNTRDYEAWRTSHSEWYGEQYAYSEQGKKRFEENPIYYEVFKLEYDVNTYIESYWKEQEYIDSVGGKKACFYTESIREGRGWKDEKAWQWFYLLVKENGKWKIINFGI